MDSELVLKIINKHITYLNGLEVKVTSLTNEMRLQNYALIILFYNLDIKWGCFDKEYANNIIKSPIKVINLIERVLSNGNTTIQIT